MNQLDDFSNGAKKLLHGKLLVLVSIKRIDYSSGVRVHT